MRILIVSDTHGWDQNLEKLLEQCGKIDLLIHAGDVQHSEDYIRALAGCPVYMVAGNNDYFSGLPKELEFMLGSHKVFLTHGHHYYVHSGCEYVRKAGKARGADIIIYGHTHRPFIEQGKDLVVLNPGSLSFPRQEDGRPTYMIMELDGRENIQIKQGSL